MPPPFYRVLKAGEHPCQTGHDVLVLQNLLQRAERSSGGTILNVTNCFDTQTASALSWFQGVVGVESTGVLDVATAKEIMEKLNDDNYVDDGLPAATRGYLYKVVVPVHSNRSMESTATLHAGNGSALLKFTVRAHGKDFAGQKGWPIYSSTPGLTQFASNGNTPTGLFSFDLNSPEPDPRSYGKWPVNRAVLGIEGNAQFLLPHLRNGILMHTGEWPNWKQGMPMPNSEGCLHAAPQDIEMVASILQHELGVKVRENPFGKLPYPYKPQGLLSIYLID